VLALYTQPAGTPKGAVIVVHGAGVNPDWGLIGELRSRLADAGFSTLSVQMPVLAADAPSEDYAPLFPAAADRLEAAVAWLRAHGATRVAVVSHSLGAAMVDAWLARPAHAPIDAWVPIGMQVPFARPPPLPVLDVTAQRDASPALEYAPRRKAELPRDKCSAAIRLPRTDHFLAGAIPAATSRIGRFLDQAFAGAC
jgi:alpha-beta hydrolase superfamily lysophospholipase